LRTSICPAMFCAGDVLRRRCDQPAVIAAAQRDVIIADQPRATIDQRQRQFRLADPRFAADQQRRPANADTACRIGAVLCWLHHRPPPLPALPRALGR